MKASFPGAEPFLPKSATLPALQQASKSCEGCDLYQNATQTVFGEGKKSARVVLIGEQPGNEEEPRRTPLHWTRR